MSCGVARRRKPCAKRCAAVTCLLYTSSGHAYQGHYLQLADLIGVEKETGFTLNYDKYNWEEHPEHFILQDITKPVDFGEGKKNMYAYADTEILVQRDREVQMAVNEFGKGRKMCIRDRYTGESSMQKKAKMSLEKRHNLTGWAFLIPAALLIFIFCFYPMVQALIPVSYTHLDVYKRQGDDAGRYGV